MFTLSFSLFKIRVIKIKIKNRYEIISYQEATWCKVCHKFGILPFLIYHKWYRRGYADKMFVHEEHIYMSVIDIVFSSLLNLFYFRRKAIVWLVWHESKVTNIKMHLQVIVFLHILPFYPTWPVHTSHGSSY